MYGLLCITMIGIDLQLSKMDRDKQGRKSLLKKNVVIYVSTQIPLLEMLPVDQGQEK